MASRFLPATWQLSDPIIILAGQGGVGSYVHSLIVSAQAAGQKVGLLSLKGETSAEVEQLFDAQSIRRVNVGDLGATLKALKDLGAKGLIMAGQVTPDRLFKDIFPDLRAVALIAGLKEKNAETIFGAVAGEIEKSGVQVLDARSFMDTDMASNGVMVKGAESVAEDAITHGTRIAEEIAKLDVGQGVVVRKGTVLAVEAFEGTNAMLARAGGFKTGEKIFVKTVKKKQDFRFDVPIFGLKTLEMCEESAIKTVVLKSDGVIMVEKPKILAEAKKRGVTIIGY